MLYIKFEIKDSSRFEDFQKLYDHMVKVRQPGFKFDDVGPEFDWDGMKSQEEVDAAVEELNTFLDQQVEPEIYRCKALLPSYVKVFLESYLQGGNESLESFGSQEVVSIFNYLEYGFEVEMDTLKKINDHLGIVKFSTANYPFGGMERFIMSLAAYDLKPVACFDGFNECDIKWTTTHEYDSVVSLKKNRFSMIKNLINNSFFKKLSFLMLLLISSHALAQMDTSTYVLNNSLEKKNKESLLVLEKPEFPSPEKALLFFFSETYFFDLHNYSENVQKVDNVRLVYHPDERIISADTSSFEFENHAFKDLRISRKPIIDHIGVDSISKKGNTVQLFHFDEEMDYVYQVYELKDAQIVTSADLTSVLYYSTEYTYNKKNKLLKVITTDDYNNKEIETATYNKNGTIRSKKSFETSDGISITTTTYSYKNKLLTQVETHSVLYFVPLDKEQKPIEKINYSKYTDDDTFINLNTVDFLYNDKNELVKVVENSKGFSENEGVNYENMQTFDLEYKSNKLIINASLPENRRYEYIFDEYANPKEINSYVVEKDTTWLHKKTIFKILYIE